MTSVHRFLTLVFLSLFLCHSSIAATKNAAVIDDPAYTHPQRLVEVEPGRRLNLYCIGKGNPTVVFESGLTDETDVWARVQPAIAAHAQACSYDRAGSGYSDPGRRAGTSANIVDDLHRLLAAANIKPPYILVGHSYGGMSVRLYADLHRDEVAGMVLIDPSEEDWVRSVWKLDLKQRTYAQKRHDELDPFWQGLRECAVANSYTYRIDRNNRFSKRTPSRYADVSAAHAAGSKLHHNTRCVMATLKGSKTEQSLKEAFGGESMANRRYLYFAQKADVEGYNDVSAVFRSTAEGETGHAHGHLEYLEQCGDPATGLPFGDTRNNLKAAIAGETHEYTDMYPGMAKTARDEGFGEVADWFETLAKAERSHANRFTKALNDLT